MQTAEALTELTYPLGAAARLTGLSPDRLRAWERRYNAVEPLRTPGGTRRYRARDIERLCLIKAAVDSGHRIGQVARLSMDELRGLGVAPPLPPLPLSELLAAIDRLDAAEVQHRLALELASRGPARFVRELALPLMHEVGERWARRSLGIAGEHLTTHALRTLLASALQARGRSPSGPRVVFATPEGERHELGLLMAALTAAGAGMSPVYLGAELPVGEMRDAVERTGASALGVGLVTPDAPHTGDWIERLRHEIPRDVHLWLGGPGAAGLILPTGVEHIEDLDALERRASMVALEG